MLRLATAGALALATCLSASAFAQNQNYPTNGYIGVFGDAAGTNCCVGIPPAAATTLHVIAVTGGETTAGITGAEFRIEISPPAPGAFLVWTSAPGANLTIGNPMDNSSAAIDNSGVNIAFPTCQKQMGMAGDHIAIGTIMVFGLTGEHTMLVKKHNRPSNPNMKAPLVVLCDSPTYTQVPLTLLEGDPKLVGLEPTSFRTPINSASCSGASCGFVAVQQRTWTALKDLYR